MQKTNHSPDLAFFLSSKIMLGCFIFLMSGVSVFAQKKNQRSNSPQSLVSSNQGLSSGGIQTNTTANNAFDLVGVSTTPIDDNTRTIGDLVGSSVPGGSTYGNAHSSAGGVTNSTNVTNCAMLYVDVDVPFLQSCVASTATVSYCNQGTSHAVNAYVDVTLDAHLNLDSASNSAYSLIAPNVYRFQIGTVLLNDCDNITLYFTTACDSTLIGDTHCIDAHIYPDGLCSGSWNDHMLDVNGVCNGNSIKFTIGNTGMPVTLGQHIQYIVIEDNFLVQGGAIVRFQDTLELGKDSIAGVSILNLSNTDYRLEIRDPSNNLLASSAVKNCSQSTLANSTVNNYYAQMFWNGSHLPSSAQGCAVNGASPVQTNATLPTANNTNINHFDNGSNNSSAAVNPSPFDELEEEATTVVVFPNPFDQFTTIKIDGPIADEFSFKLYDITGKVVQTKLLSEVRTFQVERGSLLDGMYFYQIEANGALVGSGKIIVK